MTKEHKHTLWQGFLVLSRHVATISLIMGVIAMAGQPWAEDFIRNTVDDEQFATQQSLNVIERKVDALERKIQQAQNQLSTQSNAQIRAERDLEFIKTLQAEQRRDTKRILELLNIQDE